MLGFHEGGAHRIVDLAACPVLAPDLLAMVAPLRRLLARFQNQASGKPSNTMSGRARRSRAPGGAVRRLAADITLTLADQGVDIGIVGLAPEGLAETQAWLDFAREHGLARLTCDQAYGAETLWEPEPVSVTLSGTAVPLPPGAFLQATADGEAALTGAAAAWLAPEAGMGGGVIADLFSGLGTFAFALARHGAKLLAVEADRAAHLACKAAAGRAGLAVQSMHRDLFRNPLLAEELNRFDAVLLDPPRAGAREQVARLAESMVPRIVYISCNPSSWARDAATLASAGYCLAELVPVGQFRWSTHAELASLFVRAEGSGKQK